MQYGFHEVFWISAPLSHYFINQFSTVAWSRFGRLINISSNRDEKLPPTPPPSSRLPRFLNKIFFGKIAAIKKKIIFNFIFQTSSDVLSKMSKGSLNIPFPVLNGKKRRSKEEGVGLRIIEVVHHSFSSKGTKPPQSLWFASREYRLRAGKSGEERE